MENPFKNLFKKPETSVVGVDIGSSAIKIVQLKKKGGKALLETYGAIALGPYAGVAVGQATNLPADKIAEAINDVLREANATTKNSGLSIPLRSSLVSLIEMPKVDDKQLQQMIPIEARKYIPVPISEVTLDWWVIPKEEDRYLDFVESDQTAKPKKEVSPKVDVLVVSIHNEALAHYNDIVKQSGLNSSFFEIEMFSSIRAIIESSNAPVLIIDMGASSTKLYVVERGIVRTSHIINKGSQDITLSISQGMSVSIEKAEQIKRALTDRNSEQGRQIYDIISLTLDYVFSEANSVLLSYQKRYNKSVNRVYLTGGGSALKGILDVAKATFQTDVVLGEAFLKVETPAFLEGILRETGLEFAVAVGVALRKLQDIS